MSCEPVTDRGKGLVYAYRISRSGFLQENGILTVGDAGLIEIIALITVKYLLRSSSQVAVVYRCL